MEPENWAKIKKIIIIFMVSIFFAFLSFLYSRLDFSQIHSTLDIIKIGVPQVKALILGNEFFKQIPILPAIIGWTVIGVIAYLIYYSVQLIYNNVRNWAVIEFFFQKARIKEKVDFWHFALRTLIHLAIILCYFAFLFLLVFILYKSSAIFSMHLLSGSSDSGKLINLLPNSVMVLIVWLVFFSFFAFFFFMLNKFMIVEQFEEEHGTVN